MTTTYSDQIRAIQTAMRGAALLVTDDSQQQFIHALSDAGATIAALNLSDPYKEIERLTDWKESMLKLWGPVIDWMQTKSNLELGMDISVEVLKRVQEYESLKEKLKEANDIISHYADVNQNQ